MRLALRTTPISIGIVRAGLVSADPGLALDVRASEAAMMRAVMAVAHARRAKVLPVGHGRASQTAAPHGALTQATCGVEGVGRRSEVAAEQSRRETPRGS